MFCNDCVVLKSDENMLKEKHLFHSGRNENTFNYSDEIK